mgnify:FL=1
MLKRFNNKKNLTGNSIKEARERKGLSRIQLSIKLELLGIYLDRIQIYRIEGNKLMIKDFELIGIAKILDLDLNRLKDLLD